MKSEVFKDEYGEYIWIFCPGCETHHRMKITGVIGPRWSWNGKFDSPTINPSVMVQDGDGVVCHSFIKDGKIMFLTDSRHALAGKTVDLPDLP